MSQADHEMMIFLKESLQSVGSRLHNKRAAEADESSSSKSKKHKEKTRKRKQKQYVIGDYSGAYHADEDFADLQKNRINLTNAQSIS